MEAPRMNVVVLPEEPRRIRRRMLLATAVRQRSRDRSPTRAGVDQWTRGRRARLALCAPLAGPRLSGRVIFKDLALRRPPFSPGEAARGLSAVSGARTRNQVTPRTRRRT
jgi:hypothetical protein